MGENHFPLGLRFLGRDDPDDHVGIVEGTESGPDQSFIQQAFGVHKARGVQEKDLGPGVVHHSQEAMARGLGFG
jgi:hypothetical protein